MDDSQISVDLGFSSDVYTQSDRDDNIMTPLKSSSPASFDTEQHTHNVDDPTLIDGASGNNVDDPTLAGGSAGTSSDCITVGKSAPVSSTSPTSSAGIVDDTEAIQIKNVEKERKVKFRWTQPLESELVRLYGDAKNDGLWPGPKNRHTQAHVWRRISATLNAKFKLSVNGKQCADKWITLKKKYIQLKHDNVRSGSGNEEEKLKLVFPLYCDFEKIMGASDLTVPAFEMNSILPGTDIEVIDIEGKVSLVRNSFTDNDVQVVVPGSFKSEDIVGASGKQMTSKAQGQTKIITKAKAIGSTYKKKYSDILEVNKDWNKTISDYTVDAGKRHAEMMTNARRQTDIMAELLDVMKSSQGNVFPGQQPFNNSHIPSFPGRPGPSRPTYNFNSNQDQANSFLPPGPYMSQL